MRNGFILILLTGLFAASGVRAAEPVWTLRLAAFVPYSVDLSRNKLSLELASFGGQEQSGACLLYGYAQTNGLDPISGVGFNPTDSKDAHDLGLGVHGLLTERMEFQAVLGHSHLGGSWNSAYAGLIYDFDRGFGLGADLSRSTAENQDGRRLRAFARFYF